MPAGHDLIVVGAGAVGLAVADRFLSRRPEASVLVCEDESFPAGSRAAGAMIVAWSESTAQARQQAGFSERMDAAELALRSWREELSEAEVDGIPVVTTRGLNVVLGAAAPKPEVDNFAAIREVLDERKVRWETVDVELVAGLEPEPEYGAAEAIYIPEEFVVDAALLSVWRRRRLAERGARFRRGRVRPVERGERVVGVETESEEVLESEAVVLAAGSASRRLAPESVRDLIPPLYSGVGTAATVRFDKPRPVDAFRTANRSFACGLHLLPSAGGSVYVGATNEPSRTPPSRPSVSDVEFLLRCAVLQVNRELHRAQVDGLRVGSRPTPADAVAMVGPVVDGLWMATGGLRDGLTHAPATADRL
ncbi:MAG: FAD-dependent oxidoreductase, partial [Stackebrandtia sp.]